MKRRGFTLVEVLVALVIASLLVLLAHRLFAAGIQASATVVEARRSLDRAGNGHHLLAAMLLSLDVGAEQQQPFTGHADRLRFGTWLQTPNGWFEPATVNIAREASRLTVRMSARPPLVLADSVQAVAFDYLLTLGADSRWISEWVSPLRAPMAVRLRVQRRGGDGRIIADTTLYLVKARG